MKRHSLAGSAWQVRCVEGSAARADVVGRAFPAVVPGCVHADLERAGVIRPVDEGDGEDAQTWVGHTDWEWEREFQWQGSDATRVDLVFESLDTAATVWLNGTQLGSVCNQFHPHRFDVRSVLRQGANTLRVRIAAPVPWVQRMEQELGPRPVNGDWTPYPFIRKSACSFGWDWGPRAPSSGINGSVVLEEWSGARLAEVRPLVTQCSADHAVVEVHVRVEPDGTGRAVPERVHASLVGPDGRRVEAEGSVTSGAGGAAGVAASSGAGGGAGGATCVLRLEMPKPLRWWPRSHGSQPLYDLRVALQPQADAWRRRIGLRSVALDTGADAAGSRCTVVVNGQSVFCVGANWIPASLFPVLAERSRVDALLELACEAHLNMLRVWGGGVYESEWFYERCDELGLLVWQDFMFACATYPEDAPFPAQVEQEARYQVARLASHPSVVLWCGGNEDILAWQSWGFRDRLKPGQTWGRHYWLELLPRVCAELDPTRPYWPESPWSGSLELHANDPDRGDRHTWDLKLDAYRTMVPRFCSEFGHQSPPNVRTLQETVDAGASSGASGGSGAIGGSGVIGASEGGRASSVLTLGSPQLAKRQRAWGGDEVQYAPYLAEGFGPCQTFEQWLYRAQVLQARAMETAITWLRSNQPRCMGALFWQWNDVWAGHSWSAVDVALRPKPFWHALRRAASPRMVSLQPMGPGGVEDPARSLCVALVNSLPQPWRAHMRVARVDGAGAVLAQGEDRVEVAPWCVDASVSVRALVGGPAQMESEAVVVEVVGMEGESAWWWWWCKDSALQGRAGTLDVQVRGSGEEWEVHLRARGLVREAWVEPDAAWVTAEPNLLTLRPGQQAVVKVRLAPGAGVPAGRELGVRVQHG